jgi:hypothetical protein
MLDKRKQLYNMTARGGGTYPYKITEHGAVGGYRPTPSESRNGGTVTYRPWQRNETLPDDARTSSGRKGDVAAGADFDMRPQAFLGVFGG